MLGLHHEDGVGPRNVPFVNSSILEDALLLRESHTARVSRKASQDFLITRSLSSLVK